MEYVMTHFVCGAPVLLYCFIVCVFVVPFAWVVSMSFEKIWND
jgi:hypothetical protein